MKPSSLILRCFMEREPDGSWFAICLDLSVHAHGDTPDQARANLHDRLHDYVREALVEDSEHAADLIPRRAPLYFWFRYYRLRFLVGCLRLAQSAHGFLFKDYLPVAPV